MPAAADVYRAVVTWRSLTQWTESLRHWIGDRDCRTDCLVLCKVRLLPALLPTLLRARLFYAAAPEEQQRRFVSLGALPLLLLNSSVGD